MRDFTYRPRAALGVALLAGLAGLTPSRAAAADPAPGAGPAAAVAPAPLAPVAPLPSPGMPAPMPVPVATVPLTAEPSLNALRLDLRSSLNAWELGYERALTRRIGVFAGMSVPWSIHQSFGNEEVSGMVLGGTLGARFYPVGGDSTFSGLTLTPFVDVTYLKGDSTVGGHHTSNSLTVWGVGGTVGYSWTPGDFMVIAAGLGAQTIILPHATVVLPIVTVGVGPTF